MGFSAFRKSKKRAICLVTGEKGYPPLTHCIPGSARREPWTVIVVAIDTQAEMEIEFTSHGLRRVNALNRAGCGRVRRSSAGGLAAAMQVV
jgi:hypothetical protein